MKWVTLKSLFEKMIMKSDQSVTPIQSLYNTGFESFDGQTGINDENFKFSTKYQNTVNILNEGTSSKVDKIVSDILH